MFFAHTGYSHMDTVCYDDIVSGLTEKVDGLNATDHGSGRALKKLKSDGVFSIKLSSSFGPKIHTI